MVLRPSGSLSFGVDGAWSPTLGAGATSLAVGVLSDSSSAQNLELGAVRGSVLAAAIVVACVESEAG